MSITLATVAFNNKSKTDIPEELPGPEHVRAVMPVYEDTVVVPTEIEQGIKKDRNDAYLLTSTLI